MGDVHPGDTFTLHRGTAPLLVSLPHDGSAIPDVLKARMTPTARTAPDTDWLLEPALDRMTRFMETKTVWHPIGV